RAPLRGDAPVTRARAPLRGDAPVSPKRAEGAAWYVPPMADDHVATVVRSPQGAPAAGPAAFVLLVIEGPDAGARFTVVASRPSRILAGQSPACEIRLQDAEVSRRHAAVEVTDTGLRLTDLGSTNGTWVDRVKV